MCANEVATQNKTLYVLVYILRTARSFWKDCKKKKKKRVGGGGGYFALESHPMCSSIISYMKTKVDIVGFTLKSVKNDDCAEENNTHCFFVFLLRFDLRLFLLFVYLPPLFSSFSSLPRILSPSYLGFSSFGLDYAALPRGPFEGEHCTLFRTLEASSGLPVIVCQLIFIPFIFSVYGLTIWYQNIRHYCILVGMRVVQKVFGVNYA